MKVKVEDGVALVVMSRPEKLNAFNETMACELLNCLEWCERDESVKVVVITGEGRAFSTGGDIGEMLKSIEEGEPDGFMNRLTDLLYRVALKIREMGKLVVAAVNGPAMGAGFNLAIACDMIVASDKARFAQSFVRLGLIPGMGGTYLLTRLIGPIRAGELFYTGRVVDAQEALQLGIVNRVVPHERLMEEVTGLARLIARGPLLALARTKRLLEQATRTTDLRQHLEEERKMQVESARTKDYEEGVKAFIEKREPLFRGC